MHYNDKQNIENWAEKYEKAVADGVFNEPNQEVKPTPKTSEETFFGSQNCHPTDNIADNDADYWRNVYSRTANPNYRVDSKGELINDHAITEASYLQQEQKKADPELVKTVEKIVTAANPIQYHTAGKDQDLTPQSLGLTFSPEDVNDLSEMKIRLHDLQDQLNSFEGRGTNGKKFESQIASLKAKIDDLSDSLTTTFPLQLHGSSD
jgi:hypothetical protein